MPSLKRLTPIIRPLHKACTSPFSSTPVRTVQVVSFDANDTLIADGEPFNEVYTRVAGKYGINVNSDAVAASYPKYWKNLCNSHPCFGFSSIGDFEWWKRIVIGCLQEGCSTKIEEEKGEKIAHDLFDFYAEGSAWRLTDPKLKSVLKQLRENGVGIVIVSNFDCRLKKILQDMGLYELFDMVVASGEVGVEKPNPDIFELVLQRYHLHDASQMLHIGDNVQKDFQAARQFGASALLFDPLSINAEVSSADKIRSFSELRVE